MRKGEVEIEIDDIIIVNTYTIDWWSMNSMIDIIEINIWIRRVC